MLKHKFGPCSLLRILHQLRSVFFRNFLFEKFGVDVFASISVVLRELWQYLNTYSCLWQAVELLKRHPVQQWVINSCKLPAR